MKTGWTRDDDRALAGRLPGARSLRSAAFVAVLGSLLAMSQTVPAAGAALAASAVPTPTQTAAAHRLRCGDTISRDTTLTADLTGCRGNGLIVGADGITLDLDGHTITGKGGRSGIVATGRRDIHITGSGLVHRFDTAVLLKNTTGSQVDQITVKDNNFGVTVDGGSADTVFHITARRSFEAIQFLGGDRHLAVLNTVSDNGADASGIVLDHTTRSRMVGNNISGTEFAGIWVDDADRNVVEANRITDTGRGVLVFRGSRNRISHNHIFGGLKWPRADGIALFSGTANLLDHNVVEAVAEDGITVSSFSPKGPAAIDTVVRGNVVRRAGRDGFAVKTDGPGVVRGTHLSGNRAERAGDDGFDVRSAATTIKRNVARSNTDYGIVATRGVSDGGHNRASRNGNRAQCRNVRCR